MYYEPYLDETIEISNGRWVTARNDHGCCECRKMIKAGEKYWLFFGVWWNSYIGQKFVGSYKTCRDCDGDWAKVLDAFHNRGDDEASRIYGSLHIAVEDLHDNRLITKRNSLFKKWLK